MAIDLTALLPIAAVLFAALGAYMVGLHVGRNDQ